MRYQEPENEASTMTNRRRRPAVGVSSSISSMVRSSSTSGGAAAVTPKMQNHSSIAQNLPNTSSSCRSASIDSTSGQLTADQRRLSTPFVQHDSGVMSASFQLPVHAFQTASSTLNLAAADLDEIPFIEDGLGASGSSGVVVAGTTYSPTPAGATEATLPMGV